jgi:hypothetical protein
MMDFIKWSNTIWDVPLLRLSVNPRLWKSMPLMPWKISGREPRFLILRLLLKSKTTLSIVQIPMSNVWTNKNWQDDGFYQMIKYHLRCSLSTTAVLTSDLLYLRTDRRFWIQRKKMAQTPKVVFLLIGIQRRDVIFYLVYLVGSQVVVFLTWRKRIIGCLMWLNVQKKYYIHVQWQHLQHKLYIHVVNNNIKYLLYTIYKIKKNIS